MEGFLVLDYMHRRAEGVRALAGIVNMIYLPPSRYRQVNRRVIVLRATA